MKAGGPCVILCVLAASASAEAPQFSTEQIEFFEKSVRPLLVEHCHKCHGANEQKGNLRLDSRANVLKGGDTGPAVVPGRPDEGELIAAVGYDPSGYQMPPDGKLPDEAIAVLRRWVELGAPWPAEDSIASTTGASWAEEFARRREHWSFQPLRKPRPPQVANGAWCRNAIDRFVLAKLEAAGLSPAEESDRRTWLRRAALDVTGLPPTSEDVERFLSNRAADAHEQQIDRLLDSPHFGERWGRHWLDLVRYAESRGHEFDYDVANPWPYRDYVIRALNADVPYDQFVVEHVAGDLLRGGDAAEIGTTPRHRLRLDRATGANESIVATGFWFFGEWLHSPVDIRQDEADRFENMIDVYSKTFLGLTVACARCHDHKFDPIPQSDFYALQGYLQSSVYSQVRYEHWEERGRLARELQEIEDATTTTLLPAIAELTEPVVERMDQYLLAACEALREQPESATLTETEQLSADRTDSIAASRGIEQDVLKQWMRHLSSAADDARDPFHLWGELATGRRELAGACEAIAPAEPTAAEPWLERARSERRTLEVSTFVPDRSAFRWRPRGPVVRLSPSQEQRLVRVEPGGYFDYQVAVAEAPLREKTQWESGKLEALQREGRVLRSPTFEIGHDTVCCEVRGACHTYVVVDSHTLINGPLHGSLIQAHTVEDDAADDWRWITHEVSRYRGHRAHLEIVPALGQPFAVRRAVFADAAPPESDPAGTCLPRSAGQVSDTSREELAKACAAVWREAIARLGAVHPDGLDEISAESVYAADWMLEHPELFGLDRDGAQRRLREAAHTLLARRAEVVNQLDAASALAPAMIDGSAEDEYVFIRGNWTKRGDVVPRRFLSVFDRAGPEGEALNEARDAADSGGDRTTGTTDLTGSGRLELAEQMVDPDQTPIVARVVVNRIWQHYMGRGIVPTPDDFGHLGLPPSHPELLDWLATELIAQDWSLKHIHRLILESSTYRMASAAGDESESASGRMVDPENALLWRMTLKRMEGEIIRDALLSVSGRLDREMYGPSVPVHLTSFLEGRGRPAESGPLDGRGRRSVYAAVRRNFAEPFFQAFDFPNPHTTIGRRNVSNVPAQALALMNNPMVAEQCRVAASRLLGECAGEPPEARIARLYLAVYSRPPAERELKAALEFVASQAEARKASADDPQVWADLVHVLINAKEFVFVR